MVVVTPQTDREKAKRRMVLETKGGRGGGDDG